MDSTGIGRVERAFAGGYGAAGSTASGAPGDLDVAWTGPPAPAPPSAQCSGCVLDGEIHNLEEIARIAGLPGHQEPEPTLASAYTRLGEHLIPSLRGEFALLLWDARARQGLVARDQLGAGNIFVHTGTGRLIFASELRNLLDALPSTPGPDREALVHWLAAGAVPPDRSLYEGVVPLPPASMLRLGSGRWDVARYWAPRYVEPQQLGEDEAADELRTAVFGAVDRRLRGRSSVGVLVSGGLDSGSVLAVANRVAVARGTSLRAYSAVFPGHASMDESRLVRLQVERHGVPALQLPVTGGSPLQAALRYLDRWRVPLPVPGDFVWEPVLEAAARDGAECMLDGELGDELFGAALFLIADRIRRRDVRGAVRLARSFPGVGPAPGRRLLTSLIYEYGLATWTPPALARLTAGRTPAPWWLARADARRFLLSVDAEPWRGLDGPRWWAHLADAVLRGPTRLGFFDYFRRRGRASGMPAHHPFLDLDLIELVLRLPPEHGFDAMFSRPLLRKAMHGSVPDEVRLRRDKTYFDPLLDHCLATEDRQGVTRLLGAAGAEVQSLADPAGVRGLLDDGPSRHPGGPSSWTRDVWRLATAECWLRSQSDASFPRRLLEELSSSRDRPVRRTPRLGQSYVSQP